jgi:hypothetical protein
LRSGLEVFNFCSSCLSEAHVGESGFFVELGWL